MTLASYVLDKIAVITGRISSEGGKVVVLNDPAVILWGIVKPLEEIRLIIGYLDPRLLASILADTLVMRQFEKDIIKTLMETGFTVLNPPLLPLFIIETPRNQIDRSILKENIEFNIGKHTIRIPSLEPLIAKLISIGGYPYTAYAYTLLWTYRDIIDISVIEEKYPEIHGMIRMENIRKIRNLMEIFQY